MASDLANSSLRKWEEIYAVSVAEIELIKRQSALLLQRANDGFSGELKSSGTIVEAYVKGLLAKHLPLGYRICSGYIATSSTIVTEANLSQHDLLVVDARVPSLYEFGTADIEVVPAEAVCGVIEVKRTLTKAALASAIEHLRSTKELMDGYGGGFKSKRNCSNLSAGPTLSVASQAPIYSIIALEAHLDIEAYGELLNSVMPEFLDMVWAPASGFLAMQFWKNISTGQRILPINGSRNFEGHEPAPPFFDFLSDDSARAFRRALFAFRTWINNTSGAPLSPQKNMDYFAVI